MSNFRLGASRHRKQRFPRQERRRTPIHECGNEVESDEERLTIPIKRLRESAPAVPVRPFMRSRERHIEEKLVHSNVNRIDKRARDEHNEQERSRRRELAVIYELIRCSFTNDDLRHLGPGNIPKSIEKLSYPQVLQVAYHILLEEHHHILMYERTINDVKRLEKECAKLGLPIPNRPQCPSLTENYRKVVQIVESLLKSDKAARNPTGIYELTPSERAAAGHQQLGFLRQRYSSMDNPDQTFFERRSNSHLSKKVTQNDHIRENPGFSSNNFVDDCLSHDAELKLERFSCDAFDEIDCLPHSLNLFCDPIPTGTLTSFGEVDFNLLD